MPAACFCSVCKANNPYDGCLVSNSTRFIRHEAEDQNRMREAAERRSVAAAISELPTINHDDMAYGIYVYRDSQNCPNVCQF
ncbi:hypothetical protein MAM1_0054c03530 [Mucor ambiguus]|uniref:Uncharacterized protein n=1 Tax=Mucor ambiguus TaxID=91626 RepID=A0A0C9M4B8_9FUNG|nr:hypothetical protein MAM1_0054c03530 [Mucor ambiguus]